MENFYSSLMAFEFFKGKFERDQYLIEYSVEITKKYGKKCKELNYFNEDLKQSLFLKQIIDVCSFLDEFRVFRSFAKSNEKVLNICKKVKPAIDRIEEIKGLRTYRNALAAHNFRHEKKKESIILLSDYTRNPDCPNSIAEIFFLSALCSTIIEVINTDLKDECQLAQEYYFSRLVDDKDEPLRGIKSLREAYDHIDKYRIDLELQPKFLLNEIEEFRIALNKLNWSVIPDGFELSEDETNKNWCIVLDKYLRMRGYEDINLIQGKKGKYTGIWLELYGHAVTVIERPYIFKPNDIRSNYGQITNLILDNNEENKEKIQIAYEELIKNVTP
ncbi:hypothetical protein LW139_07370 [Proteus vulgaris]|uniref:hypothetical protein n=1 Tax=Proteus vulgaris TaxID=585 RepID=UPI001FFEB718|nr:hypothetical protein [Proteus vulgaris]UPK82500.1 hypothetical protein LW139_07370 [Proteus vulgaris]